MPETQETKRAYRICKRAFDILSSVIALTLFALPLVIVGILVRLDSKGPALFKQKRCGKNKKSFYILKFRTMSTKAPSYVATRDLKISAEHTSPMGSFLRRSSIDELPQLINILKGEMSFVGPRPVINQEGDLIREREKYGANDVRPGLTGWAQINGRDDLGAVEKAKLDGFYVANRSFAMDMKILFITFVKVFKKEGIMEVSNLPEEDNKP